MEKLIRCPVCRSENIRLDFTAPTTRKTDSRQWHVDRCETCSHGFMNPQPSWEELAPYYSKDYDPYNPSHAAHGPDDEVVAKAQRTGEFRHIKIAPGNRILDVGCGAGYFLRIA
jgi:2-polyprenyl-3-methyl-5-hydroxy-6-metoxy-1,4-benzoquinol methylase